MHFERRLGSARARLEVVVADTGVAPLTDHLHPLRAIHSDGRNYLRREGFAENTLVVITSDHGEAFRERGFEGHARWLYRESTEIPLILSFPFRLDPGIVIETRSRGVDVWPTLFDLIGIPAPCLNGKPQ